MLRPERKEQRTNVARVKIVAIMTDGLSFTLQLELIEQRLYPERSYDLVTALPLHVYESLAPAVGQRWHVSLKQSALHLIKA
jgi:hypothetical protein